MIAEFTEEESRTVQLNIIGKYPYLSVNQEEIQFDSLLVGK